MLATNVDRQVTFRITILRGDSEWRGRGGNRPQSSSAASQNRGNQRGTTSGICEGISYLYAIGGHHDQENSQDVDNGMLQVFSFDIYALLDLSATLSFVTPHVITMLDFFSQCLLEPFSMFVPVGKSILVEKVYIGCTLSIQHRSTITDLVKLDMVDFDYILDMYMFYICYAQLIVEPRLSSFNFQMSLSQIGKVVLQCLKP